MQHARNSIIGRAVIIKQQIDQIFVDAASYNENFLPAGEVPIDPDPDGELRRLSEAIERMLVRERARLT